MQKQRLIILIVGIVLAIAAIIMTNTYIKQQEQTITEDAKKKVEKIKDELEKNQASVLVAKEDIPRGVAIDPNKLEVKIVPNQFVQPKAVTAIDRVTGMLTIAPISKGEQLTLSKLSYSSRGAGGALAEVTPIGKRAITVSVDNITGLVGMIKPGDYVDIIGMLPVPTQGAEGQVVNEVAVMPLFQNVLVLAVGQDTGGAVAVSQEGGRYERPESRSRDASLITVALTPQEASLSAFIQEQGRIRLVLRSPADSQKQSVQPASWATLFQYLNLLPQQQAEEQEQQGEPVGYVEVYLGVNKEVVPVYK
ncbi:Flp pilus assembly protein CpaB [Candidatus Omnitrophota bacterium]